MLAHLDGAITDCARPLSSFAKAAAATRSHRTAGAREVLIYKTVLNVEVLTADEKKQEGNQAGQKQSTGRRRAVVEVVVE
jgi:hypothetical protein